MIAREPEKTDANQLKYYKQILDKVLSTVVHINDLSDITENDIMELAGVTQNEYYNALKYTQTKGFHYL